MILNCTIEKELEINNKWYYLVKDIDKGEKYTVPKNQFKYTIVILGEVYNFYLEMPVHKKWLSLMNANYVIEKEYDLKVIEHTDTKLILACPPFTETIALQSYFWQKNADTVRCKVVGYKVGFPVFENLVNTHPKYKLNETYSFNVKGFSSFSDNNQNTYNSVIVEIEGGYELQTLALEWHKKDLWNFPDISCEVVGHIKNGLPKLRIKDDRHPIYQINEIYSFEILSFEDKIDTKTNIKHNIIRTCSKLRNSSNML